MYNMNKEKFGAFVAALRKEKGMTQKELAEALFVSDKAVSKWETGQSLPDVSLLIPLAEKLGVTVTELLQGERLESRQNITPQQVEDIVKTAVNMAGYEAPKNYKKYLLPAYIICLIIGLITQYEMYWHIYADSTIFTVPMVLLFLSAGFGLYFCFFALEKLPDYYDNNRINYYTHGIVRLNIPGVYFNNRNWKHILNNLRLWCLFTMISVPTFSLVVAYIVEYIFAALRSPYISPLHRMSTWEITITLCVGIFYIGLLFYSVYKPAKKYK